MVNHGGHCARESGRRAERVDARSACQGSPQATAQPRGLDAHGIEVASGQGAEPHGVRAGPVPSTAVIPLHTEHACCYSPSHQPRDADGRNFALGAPATRHTTRAHGETCAGVEHSEPSVEQTRGTRWRYPPGAQTTSPRSAQASKGCLPCVLWLQRTPRPLTGGALDSWRNRLGFGDYS